jgi:hypothetical protein
MEPGPIEVLDLTQFDLTVEPAPGAGPATPEEAEFDAEASALERELAELAGGAGDDWRPELEQLHADAEEGIWHDPLTVDEGELAAAAEAGEEIDGLILEAHAEIPAEAWRDLPAPYAPPSEEGGFTVTPEPGPSAPYIEPYLPTPAPPPPAGPSVSILNLTRGVVNFYPGDEWLVEITGAPAVSIVTCTAWQDGTPLGTTSYGITDGLGRWSLRGWMGEEHRGTWIEEWRVGGQLCEPVLTLYVL